MGILCVAYTVIVKFLVGVSVVVIDSRSSEMIPLCLPFLLIILANFPMGCAMGCLFGSFFLYFYIHVCIFIYVKIYVYIYIKTFTFLILPVI